MKPLATRAARSLSGQRHSDEPARTPAPQLQRWRVDFPGAGRFVRAGPPTEVGVFAGGSLAGKDSSSSSSSFSSASARDLRGGVFRGSFIRRLRGGLRKRAQPLGVNQAVKRPHHIGRQGRNSEARARRPRESSADLRSRRQCAILRATQAFQALNLIFLQLPKRFSHDTLYFATRSIFFRKSRLFKHLRRHLLPSHSAATPPGWPTGHRP